MKKIMKNRSNIIIVILLAISIFMFFQNQKFPIKHKICKVGYEDCFVSARFKDVSSCQNDVERGNWFCDSTDKNNIKCRAAVAGESFATSYCSK